MEYESQKTGGRKTGNRKNGDRGNTKNLALPPARPRSSLRHLELRVDLLVDRRIFGGKIIRIAQILCHNDMRTYGDGRGCELGDTTM